MPIHTHASHKWLTAPFFGTQRGQKAFICCNGPSFAKVNKSLLNGAGRVTIGINTSYPALRPDFWIGMDDPACFHPALVHESFPKIWRGNYRLVWCEGKHLRDTPNSYFADVGEKEPMFPILENQNFIWHRNTLAFTIQFAMWIGCHDIYFIGNDLSNKDADYGDGRTVTKEQRAYNQQCYDEIFQWLKDLTPLSYESGHRLISCTEGSRVNDIMQFIHLADVIAECEAKIPSRNPVHALDSPILTR